MKGATEYLRITPGRKEVEGGGNEIIYAGQGRRRWKATTAIRRGSQEQSRYDLGYFFNN